MRHDATVTRCTVQRAASPGHGVTVRAASRGSEVAGRSGRPTGSATVLHISHTKQENRRAKPSASRHYREEWWKKNELVTTCTHCNS